MSRVPFSIARNESSCRQRLFHEWGKGGIKLSLLVHHFLPHLAPAQYLHYSSLSVSHRCFLHPRYLNFFSSRSSQLTREVKTHNNLRFEGANLHPSCFILCCKLSQCLQEADLGQPPKWTCRAKCSFCTTSAKGAFKLEVLNGKVWTEIFLAAFRNSVHESYN